MRTDSKRDTVRITHLRGRELAKIEAALRVVGGTRAEFVRGAALRMAEGAAR